MSESRGSNHTCLFRKKDRIKNKKEIRNILHSGIKKKCHYVDFYFIGNKKCRIAIILRKKDNNAVQRNRIKRKIREIFRTTNKKECDIVVRIKKNIKNIDFKKIEEMIKSIIERD